MAQFDLPLTDLVDYRPAVAEPDDFDEFWRATLDDAAGHDLAPSFERYDALLPGVNVFDAHWSGFGGQRVAGWFITPGHSTGPRPTILQFIGYSGGRGRPHEWLTYPAAGYNVLVMDSRGQGAGDTPDLPGVGPQHAGLLTRGVLDPQDYYYRRLFTDAVRAVDAALTRPETDPSAVVVAGGSQGGAIAQAVAGLRSGLAGAVVDVPFLTHVRRATEITDAAPYQELVTLFSRNRDRVDQVFATLSYFDGVHFAARATTPALYSVALMDAICPPSTVYAAYNRYAGPKQMVVWPYNGHESGAAFQVPSTLRWLRDLLG